MRRSEKEITDYSAIESWLAKGDTCHVAFPSEEPGAAPYLIPLNYGYADGALYIHGSREGRKAGLLQDGAKVAVSIVLDNAIHQRGDPAKACGWTTHFVSILATCRVTLAHGGEQTTEFLTALMSHYGPGPFEFSPAALDKTLVARLDIESFSAKQSPAPAADAGQETS